MRTSELRALLRLLVTNPASIAGRHISRHQVFYAIWGIWAYGWFIFAACAGSWLAALVIFAPAALVAVNAPVLLIRDRTPRKQARLDKLKADIDRMEKELGL